MFAPDFMTLPTSQTSSSVPPGSGAARRDPRRPRHKKFIINLTVEQREELERRVQSGNGPKRDLIRAKAILLSDISDRGAALTDTQLATETGLSVRTIESLRRRFILDGLASAISWKQQG